MFSEVHEAHQAKLGEFPVGQRPCFGVVARPGELGSRAAVVSMAQPEIKHALNAEDAPALLACPALAELLLAEHVPRGVAQPEERLAAFRDQEALVIADPQPLQGGCDPVGSNRGATQGQRACGGKQ